MSISTKRNTNETVDKKAKIENLKSHHAKTFAKLGISNPFYSPKMAYIDKSEKVISFFPSEIEREEDKHGMISLDIQAGIIHHLEKGKTYEKRVKHTLACKENGKVKIEYRPVVITKYQPKARVY